MKIKLLIGLALSISLSCGVSAGDGKAGRPKYAGHYLDPAAQSISQIAPAPAEGSEPDRIDLAALHEWQDKRTQAECDRAKSETSASYNEVFGALTPFPAPLPKKAAAILAKIKADTDDTVVVIKSHYNRQRPFNRDAALKPCIDPSLGKIGPLAYPSGHATITRVFALLLSDLVPARKDLYMAKADEAALNRVIAGVHHPSDVEAGKRLADSLYAQFLKVPAFRKDLAKLRALLIKEPAAAQK